MSKDARRVLIDKAIAALDFAYCPYSSFPVGCALRDEHNLIHVGVNVENASYPIGGCAEAAAIAAMVVAGSKRIVELAVAGRGEMLTTPCGGCRQRIREFASPGTPIYICGPAGIRKKFTLAQLLPESFGPENLG